MSRAPASLTPLLRRGRSVRRVVVLTGAGISVPSGLAAYRGPGGIWEERPDLAEALVAGAAPDLVWRALRPMRADVLRAQPNAAHVALAAFECHLLAEGASIALITQNVDALHTRAGSQNVIELHGRLCRTRCTSCDAPPFDDDTLPFVLPKCTKCGAPLRPDVVLFNEALGVAEEMGAKRALRDCDLFVAIGTSGTVWPAASYVRSAEFEGAHTILVNLTAPEPHNDAFREVILGSAESVVPALFAV